MKSSQKESNLILIYVRPDTIYGYSDHDSWNKQGYRTTFPFEANIAAEAFNPYIHTKNDTFSVSKTAQHASKFVLPCSEFLIEIAKNNSKTLDVDHDFATTTDISVFVQENILN